MSHCNARRRAVFAAMTYGVLLTTVPAVQAQAQRYPERTVRLVTIGSAGTGVDDYTRLLARFLSQRLGQAVVVENRPGANMILANDAVAKAAPDGYTLLLTASSSMSANPSLYRQLPYNPMKDFVPVARLSTVPLALVVGSGSPYKSVEDLVNAARAKPGVINGASSSTGYRLISAAFTKSAGIKTIDVPYKATSAVLTDVIGGTVDFSVVEFAGALPLIQSNKLRALAVISPKRIGLLPGVPTLGEAAMQNTKLVEMVSRINWIGLFAPTGTPTPVIEKLGKLAVEFAGSPEAGSHYARRGSLANPGSGNELGKAVLEDQKVWKALIEEAGVKPE